MRFTWGHGILVFFVIFFAWIISFVVFSLSENNDLVTRDYYKQGANYTLKMEIDKRSAIYKDSISIKNGGDGVVMEFAPTLSANFSEKEVYFYRPSGEKDDVKLLVPTGQKGLFVSASQLVKGRYKVSVSWIQNEDKYSVSQDFVVR